MMKIRADFAEPAAVHTCELEWTASPMAGVERRMLDRIGGEVARATSLVRYAPGSHFSAHTHSGGEEFIVLEGTFQDEHADYPAGTYVRNPIGTQHIPRSDDGCTIFVKLWQFSPADTRQFAIDLNLCALSPDPENPQIEGAVLHSVADETVRLEQWSAGAERSFAEFQGAEILVLEGELIFDGECYRKHDWLRLPPASQAHVASGSSGARVWIKTGHLGKIARDGWQSPQVD